MGVWLGIERRSGQYIVFDKELGGIRHAHTIKPMPDPQQWQVEKIQVHAYIFQAVILK